MDIKEILKDKKKLPLIIAGGVALLLFIILIILLLTKKPKEKQPSSGTSGKQPVGSSEAPSGTSNTLTYWGL